MREFDDNPHSYGPVLRRIAILVSVVVLVPVMLWTITTFMRTYVAQPVIASPKPLLAPATTASINTSSPPAAGNANTAPVQTASITATGTANDSSPPSTAAKVAALATSDMPPSVAPQSQAPDSPTANAGSPWPDPSQAIGGQGIGTRQASSPRVAATGDNGDDALPPAAPLTGPIPLPPRRPAVIAMAVPGAVPLPRARPSEAGTPAETTSESGSGLLNHLFGQTH